MCCHHYYLLFRELCIMDSRSLEGYFKRINYDGISSPTLETLNSLQGHHIRAIPFENLNPLLGLPVRLDMESIMQKLVYGGRGGYCFENNLLFRDVLQTLGFKVQGLEARVISSAADIHAMRRTHMVLLVNVGDEKYTVDVGYGGLNPALPLIFRPDIEQSSSFEKYRFLKEEGNFNLQVNTAGEWKYMYSLDLQEQYPIDYELANWYVSTSPDSKFTKSLIVSRRGESGRSTLKNNILSTYDFEGGMKQVHLATVDEMKSALTGIFGINISHLPALDSKLKNLIAEGQEIQN